MKECCYNCKNLYNEYSNCQGMVDKEHEKCHEYIEEDTDGN